MSSTMPLVEAKDGWGNWSSGQKRRRVEEGEENQTKENKHTGLSFNSIQPRCARSFIRIPADQFTFHTEDWKTKQTSIYVPITDDIMVNMRSTEQISLISGTFHVGDSTGTYQGTSEGNVLHLWRYDDKQRILFVARSFLFTNMQGFLLVRKQLEDI